MQQIEGTGVCASCGSPTPWQRQARRTPGIEEVNVRSQVKIDRELVRVRQRLKLSRALFAVYLRTNVRTLENRESRDERIRTNAQAALLINLVKQSPDTVARPAAI